MLTRDVLLPSSLNVKPKWSQVVNLGSRRDQGNDVQLCPGTQPKSAFAPEAAIQIQYVIRELGRFHMYSVSDLFQDLTSDKESLTTNSRLTRTSQSFSIDQSDRASSALLFTMPASRAASLPSVSALGLGRQCLRSRSPLLLRLESSRRRRQPRELALVVPSADTQSRPQSTSPHHPGSQGSNQKAQQRPKVSLKTLLWQGIVGDSKRTWYAIKNTSLREVMRKNPIEGATAIIAYGSPC